MNWSRIEELRAEVGAEAFSDVLDLFLEETDDKVAEIRARRDRTCLADDMHFLKGAALNLGFDALAEACQHAEDETKEGNAEAVEVEAILALYAQGRKALLDAQDQLGVTLRQTG